MMSARKPSKLIKSLLKLFRALQKMSELQSILKSNARRSAKS